jgi:hypothetical protein
MTNKPVYLKKLLTIREMQLKTTITYCYTPIRVARVKNNEQLVKKMDHSYSADEKARWSSFPEDRSGISLRVRCTTAM